MKKILLLSLLLSTNLLYSQPTYLVYKKNTTILRSFYKGNYITFQTKNKQLQSGNITAINKDSFFIQPYSVIYGWISTDTIKYSTIGFAITDIYAIPNSGIQIDNFNGRNKIRGNAGHVHWYWIKSGWIFRAASVGYVALNISNDIISGNPPLTKNNLRNFGKAALVFGFGKLLKMHYKVLLKIGKKYQAVII